MSQNLILYNLRKNSKYKLGTVAKETKVPRILLYLYERGYIFPIKKHLESLARFYKVDVIRFEDNLRYPTEIFDSGSKFYSKLIKFLTSFKFFILSLCLSIVFAGLAFTGLGLTNYGDNHVKDFYSNDVLNLYNYVGTNGSVESNIIELSVIQYTAQDGNSLEIGIPTDVREYNYALIHSSIAGTNEGYVFSFIQNIVNRFSYAFFIYESDGVTLKYNVMGEFNAQDEMAIVSLSDGNDKEIKDETVISDVLKIANSSFIIAKTDFAEWVESLPTSTVNKDLYKTIKDMHKGNEIKAFYVNTGTKFVLSFTILASCCAFITLASLGGYLLRKRNEKLIGLSTIKEDYVCEKPRSLKPNWKFFPFLPEFILRYLALGLILASSMYLFLTALKFTNNISIEGIITALPDALEYYKLIPFIPIATVLLFFTKTEIMQSKKTIMLQIMSFAFIGIVYYIIECLITYSFYRMGNIYLSSMFSLLPMLLPGNLFWGLSCFSLILMFLFTTPKFKNKNSVVWWRLLVLIPIMYLVFSYLYSVGISLWGWTKWPDYLANLLYRKQLICTVFAICYPLFIYFYRIYIRKHYSEKDAALYFCGNKYIFIKNLAAATIIALLVLVNFLMKGNEYAKTLDLNKSYYIAITIPFILFYHPHFGKRNIIMDNLFNVLYGFSFSFGYAYIAIFLMGFNFTIV